MATTHNVDPSQRRFDGAGCVGTTILFVVVLFIMGAILNRSGAAETPTLPPDDNVAALAPAALATLIPTAVVPTAAPTSTQTPTSVPPTATTAPPTATHTPEPTVTATAVSPTIAPTETILFPTSTPLTIAAPEPLPMPHDVYSWTLRVPILMYHYVSSPPEDADVYRTDLSVEPDVFAQQMAYLAENGYTTIDFYDLARAISDKMELPPKPVILTFDDGYVDNYINAFPILQQYGLTGTFFVVTEFMDAGHEGYMTWEMVQEMAAAGHRFEPHSRTHPDLRNRERDFLIWQMLGPQETLAYHLGYTPRFFSYPSGRYDDMAITLLNELGYWGAVTTMSGKWHGFVDRYQWTRLRVRYDTPLAEFVDLVDPADTLGGKAFDQ